MNSQVINIFAFTHPSNVYYIPKRAEPSFKHQIHSSEQNRVKKKSSLTELTSSESKQEICRQIEYIECEVRVGLEILNNRVVRAGLSEKMTSEQSPNEVRKQVLQISRGSASTKHVSFPRNS